MRASSRISRRVGAIAESATLAVDAKAKALQAAGERRHRLRRRRARLPDARRTSSRPRSRRAATRRTTILADAGPARAARGDRGQDHARLRLRRAAAARCSSPTAASTRSTTRSRRCSTRATRCCCPRRTGPPTPRRSRSPAACRSCCPTTEATGFRVTVEQLEAARTPRTKALLFVSPSNPTGAVYPPDEVEAIGRWAVEHGIWVVTDEIYEHLTYGDHVFTSMPALVPELADTLRRAQRRRQDLRDDGLARRLDDRPRDVDRRGDQPAVALDVERRERRAARRARRGRAATSTRSRDARRVRRAAAR